MVEINSEKQNKIKRMKRTEDSLRDRRVSDIKCTNIWIIGAPEEEKEEEEEKEWVWENFWKDYSSKSLQHGKGNSQSSPRGTESHIG